MQIVFLGFFEWRVNSFSGRYCSRPWFCERIEKSAFYFREVSISFYDIFFLWYNLVLILYVLNASQSSSKYQPSSGQYSIYRLNDGWCFDDGVILKAVHWTHVWYCFVHVLDGSIQLWLILLMILKLYITHMFLSYLNF